MVTNEMFAEMALSLPGTEEKPHFDRKAFKVINKRIFATLHEESSTANLKLSDVDQSVFCQYGENVIYAVPKWGCLNRIQPSKIFYLSCLPYKLHIKPWRIPGSLQELVDCSEQVPGVRDGFHYSSLRDQNRYIFHGFKYNGLF
jgi:hypothetical protein